MALPINAISNDYRSGLYDPSTGERLGAYDPTIHVPVGDWPPIPAKEGEDPGQAAHESECEHLADAISETVWNGMHWPELRPYFIRKNYTPDGLTISTCRYQYPSQHR